MFTLNVYTLNTLTCAARSSLSLVYQVPLSLKANYRNTEIATNNHPSALTNQRQGFVRDSVLGGDLSMQMAVWSYYEQMGLQVKRACALCTGYLLSVAGVLYQRIHVRLD